MHSNTEQKPAQDMPKRCKFKVFLNCCFLQKTNYLPTLAQLFPATTTCNIRNIIAAHETRLTVTSRLMKHKFETFSDLSWSALLATA